MKDCRECQCRDSVARMALLSGQWPSWRHIGAGFFTPCPPSPRQRRYEGSRDRAILYLALLFLARAWMPDEPYWAALLAALGVWAPIIVLGAAVRGWYFAIGADPDSCDNGHRP